MSAHTAGQRSAIMADLAVAPLPKSFLGCDMVELTTKDGLPEIGNYSLAMFVAPDASAPVKAAGRPYPRDVRSLQGRPAGSERDAGTPCHAASGRFGRSADQGVSRCGSPTTKPSSGTISPSSTARWTCGRSTSDAIRGELRRVSSSQQARGGAVQGGANDEKYAEVLRQGAGFYQAIGASGHDVCSRSKRRRSMPEHDMVRPYLPRRLPQEGWRDAARSSSTSSTCCSGAKADRRYSLSSPATRWGSTDSTDWWTKRANRA